MDTPHTPAETPTPPAPEQPPTPNPVPAIAPVAVGGPDRAAAEVVGSAPADPQGSTPTPAPPRPAHSTPHPLDLSRIAQDLQIRKVQVEAVVQLLDEDNTI